MLVSSAEDVDEGLGLIEDFLAEFAITLREVHALALLGGCVVRMLAYVPVGLALEVLPVVSKNVYELSLLECSDLLVDLG